MRTAAQRSMPNQRTAHSGWSRAVVLMGVMRVHEQVIASVDVGSVKTAVVVGQIDRDRHLHILGASQAPTFGMKRGGVVNMDEVANAIAVALERVAHLTGQRLTSAYFSISGNHIASTNHTGAVAITPTDRDIDAADVKHVLDVAGAIPLEAHRLIVAVMPRAYRIDGQDSIKNPIGMSGFRLEVEAHVVTGAQSAYRNLLKCAERAHIEVEDIVVGSLAAAEAVLAPSERDLGTVLIDIGGGTADIAIFADGGVWRTLTLPLGGSLITDDIAYGLRLPMPVAEALKTQYGAATPDRIAATEMVELGQFLPNCQEVVARRTLASIIQPRIEEMLTMIRDEVSRSGRDRLLAGGVVLTGGTAELAGITEVAAQIFDAPVRIGAPHSLDGVTETIVQPAFAAAVGLLRWHENALAGDVLEGEQNGMLQAGMAAIRRLFQRAG